MWVVDCACTILTTFTILCNEHYAATGDVVKFSLLDNCRKLNCYWGCNEKFTTSLIPHKKYHIASVLKLPIICERI